MERSSEEERKLQAAVAALKSETCWSIIAGEGTGSLISLAFGEKNKRPRILRNRNLTEEEREFEGEFELYVECAWRLETEQDVLCTSTSSNGSGGLMIEALRQLVGKAINQARLMWPAADIRLDFDGGFSLLLFADQANELDNYCNYTLSTEYETIVNGSKSKISFSRRR